MVRRDWANTRSYRMAFILDAFFGILELATYYFISQSLGNFTPADLAGAPTYFAFAAIGAVIAIVIHAASAGIGERLRQEQLTGTLETLLTNPLTSVELCLGLVGFPFLFALARTVVYLGIAGAWMNLDVSQTSWPGLGLVLVSAAFALSALGILAGAIVLVLKRGDVLTGTIVFGMTLVSGSVFPISALPDWLEPIGKIVPTRFAFDGARAALFTGNGWETDAAFLAAFGVAALPLCLIAFSRALSYAKRSGSLAQY